MKRAYVLLNSYWNGDHYSDEDVLFAGWTEAEGRAALVKAEAGKAVQRGDEQVRLLEMEIPEQVASLAIAADDCRTCNGEGMIDRSDSTPLEWLVDCPDCRK